MNDTPTLEASECLDYGRDDCGGAVEYRMPLSASGQAFPRCADHWGQRLRDQDEINQRYGGDLAPADFDPTYAGEEW